MTVDIRPNEPKAHGRCDMCEEITDDCRWYEEADRWLCIRCAYDVYEGGK